MKYLLFHEGGLLNMLHTIKRKQLIKSDIEMVWSFISSPMNLTLITPSYMEFEIISDKADLETIYPGQIIEYYVRPLAGIKMHWVTEITHVDPKRSFVDEQRLGPYSVWHHRHSLKEVNGGVEMLDVVHYKVPFGIIGRVVNFLFLKKRLKKVFDYRYNMIEEIFS